MRLETRRERILLWFELKIWWWQATLTGRCFVCGLKGVHKMDCNGKDWRF